MKSSIFAAVSGVALLCGASGPALGQVQPQPAAPAPAIALPRDTPYPGMLKLAVDATDLPHAIFRVHETVPIQGPGPVTLLYPKWLPGNHSPSGPIDKLAGLEITANGKRVEWRRDPLDVYAFHVDAPAGARALELDFQFLSPVSNREGRIVMTPAMLNVEWNAVALYPAGYFSRQVKIQPSVTLPDGFKLATALETASSNGATTTFKPTTFNTLVDSPLIAGRNRKSTDLSFSIGMTINAMGALSEVIWDGPAFKAGLTEGTQIVAVNGDAYSADDLKDAIKAAKGGAAAIDLLVKDNDQFRTVRVDYHEGLRYPHLERVAGAAAGLDEILEPRK